MVWRAEDPQGNEAEKIKWDLVEFTRGRGLDLGSGNYKPFPHFIGVDNCNHNQFGHNIRPDVFVQSCEKLDIFASQSMDFVFSSHLLEHIENWKGALREWFRVVKNGGYLILYVPHKDFYPNIGQPGANPDHKQDFLPKDVVDAMRSIPGWELVRNEDRNEDREYSFFQVYKKRSDDKFVESWRNSKPSKTCAVIRYGAFGDLIQAASLFPHLKDQGYHVTLFTTPRGHEVVKEDPNIDKVVLQETDQVPNHELLQFWEWMNRKYDKVVNLCEAVEATWLALPDRVNHKWPHEVRHQLMNKNYLEFQHLLAGVPYIPKQKFFPHANEAKWALKQKEQFGGFTILWSLAGSSIHKVWPHLDPIIARLLLSRHDAKIVLVGDAMCQMLEAGWESEPRVIKKSGVWGIRESLAFAQIADLVVGPETGVLNAVAFDNVPKIVTLSHSSVENLTRDWVNCTSLTPENTPCYPCHQMHYGFTHCHRDDETGVAKCQADISVDQMWNAIERVMEKCQAPALLRTA